MKELNRYLVENSLIKRLMLILYFNVTTMKIQVVDNEE